MRCPCRLLLLLGGVLSSGLSNATAQRPGFIEGRVLDRVGRPVPLVHVTVERQGTVSGEATTGANGSFSIGNLNPDRYRLSLRRIGYRAESQDVQVEPQRATRLTLFLDTAPLTLDTIVVRAGGEAPTDLGAKLESHEIVLLPTTVDVRQLVSLTPGARPDQIWGGASDQANAYVLDGATITHAGVGGALLLPSPRWLERLEVRGLGAGADAAGAQGGSVEMVTLDGGAVLEGSARTSFESHQLNGSNLVVGEIGRELTSRWEVDGQLRGPLVPNHLYFALFGNGVRQEERVPNYLPSRSAAGPFVAQSPSLGDYRWLAKLTGQPGTGNRDVVLGSLFGRHTNGERIGQTGYEGAEATERLRQWNVAWSFTWRHTGDAGTGGGLSVQVGGYAGSDRHEPYAGPAVPGIEVFQRTTPPRFQNAPFHTRGAPWSFDLKTTWTLLGALKIGGEHSIGGWAYERRRNAAMTWAPVPVSGFDPTLPSTWVWQGAIGTSWGGEVSLSSRTQNSALFVQDHIGILPWLALDPGVRLGWWTGTLVPTSGARLRVAQDRALDPRIGIAAELDRANGFVAKVHWGRYHQAMFAALFDRAAGGDVYSDEERWSYLGPPPTTPADVFTRRERDSLAAAGLFRLDETTRLAEAGRVENYRQPYVDQAVASLERNIGSHLKAGVVYVRRRNHNMVALVDRNLATNYTVVENVVVRDRFGRPVFFGGEQLVLDRLAISNEDILYVMELLRQGALLGGNQLFVPPNLSAADLAALRYAPDYVLTTVPEATRRFEQMQLRLDARFPKWWAGGSATLSTLVGNYNVVTGPDDYTTGGAGPWVRLNEQYGFYGALNNQSRIEAKIYAGALLPGGFRGGAFLSYATGDRFTPTMLISGLLSQYAAVVPRASNPAISDTLAFHPFLFRSTAGQRIFIQPRGSYRYDSRVSLDLHLERALGRRGAEVVVMVDGFNVLGNRAVTSTQTVVNSFGGLFDSDYGRVLGRVPPRTLRLSAEARF